ncbi:MAG: C1 family peptidase [Flavobacteriales bacterium]
MKKLSALLLSTSLVMLAFTAVTLESPYTFTTIKNNAAGITEDQCATGTCWSFATISFLESEIIRKGGKAVDLSEMYNVRVNYTRKVDSYVRYQGKQQFGPGGLSHDAVYVMKHNGLVPESAYTGFLTGQKEYDHSALDGLMESAVKTVIDKKLNEHSNDWKVGIEGMLDASIGKAPAEFEYEGKKYTPATFRDAMKLNADDYVSITSFTHHPFYSQFVLEVPDNWAKGSFYNVTMEDMQNILDNAIDNGYTVAWDADVSEKGFSFKEGVAILPADEVKKEDMWKSIVAEKPVTQATRQEGFDQFRTTDDHLMHITGKAKDQNGSIYYMTKNSWGTENLFGGFQYVSKNYFQMKTISIMVHKDAVPGELKKKIGL